MSNLTLTDAIRNLDDIADHFHAVHTGMKSAMQQTQGLRQESIGTPTHGPHDFGQNDLFAQLDEHIGQSTMDLLCQSFAMVNATNVPYARPAPEQDVPAEAGVVINGEARCVADD